MNREDIIRMAREVGMTYMPHITEISMQQVIAFAKLVAQHEREACANLFDERDKDIGWYDPGEPAEIIRARNK